ncbi:MFS transporter [Pontibacter ummariensis]|uniref:MFS transporter n=1 Tax=Pontibacter ummariensis TaxID=1610492 RepID=UPI001186645B|nr:MFS transporter [Pontibacter ummariensis]
MKLVRELFLIQFCLGIATAFLFTSSLTLFLSAYEVKVFPLVYLAAAALLLVFNYLYARLEAMVSALRCLRVVVAFSVTVVLTFWLIQHFYSFGWSPLWLATWSIIIYMLIGYAFWGMTAILFNVRESRRLFSVVGGGDIPAKMLGYLSVSVLVPFVGVLNLLWVSVGAFTVAFALLGRLRHERLLEPEEHIHQHRTQVRGTSFVSSLFQNHLIFYLALWSLLAYTIIFFIDFTFLSEIKVNYESSHELATFIAVFFALGRLLAIVFKLMFSSRVIARLGLTSSLLLAPVVLFLVNGFILLANDALTVHLYAFGTMVLLFEVLRSTIQEPVFFVLFQPLHPHVRLKGHLIAKGYTLPFALLAVGGFLTVYLQHYDHVAIPLVSSILMLVLLAWASSVYFVRKAYLKTLMQALARGYFAGSELFLNDRTVIDLLVQKAKGHKPKEVIHALDLLERSGYSKLSELLLQQLQHKLLDVKEYVIAKVMEKSMIEAVPILREQLKANLVPRLKPLLLKALFFLDREKGGALELALRQLSPDCRKAAMEGLLLQPRNENVSKVVMQELQKMMTGGTPDKLAALDVIAETKLPDGIQGLESLLKDKDRQVWQRAVAVAGKVKAFQYLPHLLQLAGRKEDQGILQRTLPDFGDELYTAEHYPVSLLPDPLLAIFIKVAAKTKGENSTAFLERVFRSSPDKADLVVEALWAKKASLSLPMQEELKHWLMRKLHQSHTKVGYYIALLPDNTVELLRNALCSELQQDVRNVLKGLSLVYHREQIDRVIEVEQLRDSHKLSNALEMLELLLPKKFFTKLDALVELMQDIRCQQLVLPRQATRGTASVIGEILTGSGCNAWTKAVACYIVPQLQERSLALQLLDRPGDPADALFQETRNYVVSVLN